jgi:hypothetical protein
MRPTIALCSKLRTHFRSTPMEILSASGRWCPVPYGSLFGNISKKRSERLTGDPGQGVDDCPHHAGIDLGVGGCSRTKRVHVVHERSAGIRYAACFICNARIEVHNSGLAQS